MDKIDEWLKRTEFDEKPKAKKENSFQKDVKRAPASETSQKRKTSDQKKGKQFFGKPKAKFQKTQHKKAYKPACKELPLFPVHSPTLS